MSDLPDYARRLKAALALKGWTMVELADAVPTPYRLSKSTLDKIAQGKRAPLGWEVELFAELLDVPQWFLERGFDGVPMTSLRSDADLHRADFVFVDESGELTVVEVKRSLDSIREAAEQTKAYLEELNQREAGAARAEQLAVDPADRLRVPKPGGGPDGLR